MEVALQPRRYFMTRSAAVSFGLATVVSTLFTLLAILTPMTIGSTIEHSHQIFRSSRQPIERLRLINGAQEGWSFHRHFMRQGLTGSRSSIRGSMIIECAVKKPWRSWAIRRQILTCSRFGEGSGRSTMLLGQGKAHLPSIQMIIPPPGASTLTPFWVFF